MENLRLLTYRDNRGYAHAFWMTKDGVRGYLNNLTAGRTIKHARIVHGLTEITITSDDGGRPSLEVTATFNTDIDPSYTDHLTEQE